MSLYDRNSYAYLPESGDEYIGLPRYTAPRQAQYNVQSPRLTDVHGPGKRRRFEPADYRQFAIHCACCALIYPVLYICVVLSENRSLFTVRLIVGFGIMVIAVLMGISLHIFAKRFVEATTWATLIEQNDVKNKKRRMTFYELAEVSADPASPLSALRLFVVRLRIRINSHRLWYAYIIFALSFLTLAGVLSFALGRIVDITAVGSFQSSKFTEVPIWGDGADNASIPLTFEDYNIHYRTADGNASSLLQSPAPPAWRFDTPQASMQQFQNETIFFTNPYSAQLREDKFAYGAMAAEEHDQFVMQPKTTKVTNPEESSLLQFPQWGVRVKCERLPDVAQNIVIDPNLGFANVTIPTSLPSDLYSSLGLPFPGDLLRNTQPHYGPTLSRDNLYFPVTVPGNASTPETLMTIMFAWEVLLNHTLLTPRDEEGHLVAGFITDRGTGGSGWTVFDVMFVRCLAINFRSWCNNFPLVQSYMPQSEEQVGYDAIACVQHVEPWVIEVRNSTIGVALLDVLGQGNGVDAGGLSLAGERIGASLGQNVERSIRTSNKVVTFYTAYVVTTYAWLAQTGKLGFPTLLDQSYMEYKTTNGTLSAPLFEKFRGITTATTILPLLASTTKLLARQFRGEQIAFASIRAVPLLVTIALLLIAGVLGCLFVPALPKGFPRRRFDMYSWLMAVKGDGLKVDDPVDEGDEPERDDADSVLKKEGIEWKPGMKLEDVEKDYSKKRIVVLPIANMTDSA